MRENQDTIAKWADESFGDPTSNLRLAIRANAEMAELITELSIDDEHKKAPEEVADIIICLCRLASELGIDMQDEVDKKMEKNRSRNWKVDGTGCAQHVEEDDD
jgi:NTP pyrophosphatase (non-canonical NTP hydrolase)